jgi:hypothetical protein
MLKLSTVPGPVGGVSGRHVAVAGCVAGIALVLLGAVGRTSLPSLFLHGWQSLTPGSSQRHAPTPTSTDTVSPVGSTPIAPAVDVGSRPSALPAQRGRVLSPHGPHAAPTAAPGGPVAATPPSQPHGAPGPGTAPTAAAPPPASGGGSEPTPAPLPQPAPPPAPSISLDATSTSVGIGVDTGTGTSAGATVPVPSDPTQVDTPTVTTSLPATVPVTAPPLP